MMSEAREELAHLNVLASFEDMEAARRGIGALEMRGFDGADLSLLGPDPERAREQGDTSEEDAGVLSQLGRRTAAGAAVGSTAGGATGFVAGLIASTVPGIGPVIGAGVWAATLGGAAAGGAVGGILGGESSLHTSEAAELTFTNVRAGGTTVAVHTEDDDDVDKAVEILESAGAEQVAVYDKDGHPVERA